MKGNGLKKTKISKINTVSKSNLTLPTKSEEKYPQMPKSLIMKLSERKKSRSKTQEY
jgi:hypothetical protein